MASRTVIYGKYELLQRINVGGMAEVFKARLVGSEGGGNYVAIKRILPSIAEDRDFINMFIDEAKLTVQLSHPNIARTYELGKSNDTYYITMEYVAGKDLRTVFERLRRKTKAVPPQLAAYVIACVAAGLDYAHHKSDAEGNPLGIVHRDVTPQNILLSFDGDVKIIDFGIAKAENKIQRTQVGILKGKFGYMSPEQVAGKKIDHRSDLFSLGVVLYELLAGERLFVGTNDHSVLDKVRNTDIPELTELRPDVPPALVQIVSHALTKDPADRYQRARELEADLRNYLNAQASPFTQADLASFMRTTLAEDYLYEARETAPEPMVPDEPDWPRPQPSVSVPKIRATLLQHDLRPHLEGAAPTASIAPGLPDPMLGADAVRELKLNLAAMAHDTDPTREAPPPPVEEPPPPPVDAQAAQSNLELTAEALMFEAELSLTNENARMAGLSAAAHAAGSVPDKLKLPPPSVVTELAAEVTSVSKPPAQRPTRPLFEEDEQTRIAPVPPETFRPPPKPSQEPTNVGPIIPARKKKTFPWKPFLTFAAILTLITFVGVKWWWPNVRPQGSEPSKLDLFAAPGYSAVEVKTDPNDAQLLLDGVMVKPGGMEPFKSEHLDSDLTHTLIARKVGYHEATETFSLHRDESRLITLRLEPEGAVLRVETDPPRSDIYVDGEMQGHDGESIGAIAPGKHVLRAEKQCYQPTEQAIDLGPAGLIVKLTLKPLVGACAVSPEDRVGGYGTLRLYSHPSAHVFIDGKDSGQMTPMLDYRLPPGHHQVRLVSEQGAQELDVAIQAGHAETQTVMFDPLHRR